MKRSHLIVGGVVLLALVLFFYLRGGDDGAGKAAAPTGGDVSEVTAATKQVALQRQAGGGDRVDALIDDDPEGTLRLEGQVINDTDDPVAGARVTIGSNPPRTAVTGQDGAFYFDKLLGRPYQLVARAEAGVAGPVTATLTATSDPVILRLKPAAAVQVKVISAVDRSPISGATVELRDLEVQTATTDAGGVAKLTNVVPGGYRLAAYGPGYAKSHAWVRVPSGDVTATTTLQLRKGTAVSGLVSAPDGSPVAGARVVYSGASDWAQQADPRHDAAVSDDEGRFRFDALPPGSFRFVARHQAYAPGTSELVTLDGTSERGGVNIQLEAGATLTGTVENGDGEPMPSARVRVAVRTAGMRWEQPRQAYTDEAGAFTISGLPQRPIEVVAVHEVASSDIAEVDLTGVDTESIELLLDLAGTISGVVEDSAGEPIEGAQVVAWPDFTSRQGRRQARRNMRLRGWNNQLTDAGGRFTITGLEEGEYGLRATPPGSTGGWRRMMMREETEAKTGDTDVRIVLPADGGVKGRVELDSGDPVTIFTIGAGFRGGTPFTSEKGEFELRDLAPETYSFTIRGPDFDPKTVADIRVEEGAITDLGTIVVSKGRSVTGRVTLNGVGVAGATVLAARRMFGSGSSAKAQFGPFGNQSKEVQTDDSGNFVMNGVGPADLMIVAEHEEKGRSKTLPIRGTRDSIHGVELALEPYGALTGKVTLNGKPAEGVRIGSASQAAPSVVFGVATGADGVFRYDKLAPDVYKVSAIPGSGGPMGGMSFHSRTVTVVSGQTATVDIEISEGPLKVAVKPVPPGGGAPSFGFVNWARGEVTARTARELELAIAALGEGQSGFGMSIRGNAATINGLQPGAYTFCVTPYPKEVTGMRDTMAYNQRQGDDLRVFCKPVTLAAEPESQTVEIPVEIPEFVPPPDEG
jgi:protocatechuate 3,4-dioxygenase beta subunit